MASMIQIRNVPEDLHRKLKSRAALAGMSLSEYLLREIQEIASRMTIEEMRARLESYPVAHLSISSADVIREARDQR